MNPIARLLLLLPAALLAGCPGSPGRIRATPTSPADFVQSRAEVYVLGRAGLRRVAVDGSAYQRIHGNRYTLHDMSADEQTLVLGDSNTNLFVSKGGTIHRIREIDGRCSDAILAPDASRVAAVRHADFSLPQSVQTDDDTVYVVDVATMKVSTIPATGRTGMPVRITWDPVDSDAVWIRLHSGVQRVDVSTGARTQFSVGTNPPVPASGARPARGSQDCATGARIELQGWRGDEGIELVDANGERRMLVPVDGRVRGFHDYQSTIGTAFFVDQCKYVVYGFGGSIWVVDVATGQTGPLAPGTDAYPVP